MGCPFDMVSPPFLTRKVPRGWSNGLFSTLLDTVLLD